MRQAVWIDEADALALHDRLLALHGGAAGLRDVGLLKSVQARAQQHFDIVDLGALYTAGIVRNHPFVMATSARGLGWEFCFSNSMAIGSPPVKKMPRERSCSLRREISM